ncbi:MAG: hypothetical protein JXB38_05835 [Anaerolineales bacterium]|nr:hypothetical protein [Anaerolineales bacterium]
MTNEKRLRPSDLVNWNNKELIEQYIQKFMGILFINENGEVKSTETFKLHAYLRILSKNINMKDISSLHTKEILIYRAGFNRIKKYKKQNIHTFRQALSAEVRRYLKRPIAEYWILFPLHISYGQLDKIRSISIFNQKLYIRSWNYVKKHFELDKLLEDSKYHIRETNNSLETHFTPILIKSTGLDTDNVLEKADKAFELFRWLLNFLAQSGYMRISYGDYEKPLAKILPCPIYGFFLPDGQYDTYYYNTTKYTNYRKNTINYELVVNAKIIFDKLITNGNNNNTVDLLIEAIEKYGNALDTHSRMLTFLKLWQVLEILALQTTKNINMKIVKSRIKILLNQDQLAKDLLDTLYETRNDLVHKGLFPDDEGSEQGSKEIGLLKMVVEKSVVV